MAPRRRKQPAKAGSQQASGSRRSTRIAHKASGANNEVPEVFADMIAESGPPTRYQAHEQSRPLKRRRVGVEGSALALRKAQPALEEAPKDRSQVSSPDSLFSAGGNVPEEIIVEEEESEDSEVEWEEVALNAEPTVPAPTTPAKANSKDQAVLTINLNATVTPKQTTKRAARRPLSSSEKQLRLTVHKLHLLCLLSHVSKRNHLCNDGEAQSILKRLVPARVITQLHVEPRYSQMQRTKAFIESLEQIVELWHQRFRITATGMRKSKWAANLDSLKEYKLSDTAEDPIDRADFRRAAKSPEGSVDLGAQLLCCLLRAVDVETRLVCSLQPLPHGSSTEPVTPQNTPAKQSPRNGKTTIYLNNSEDEESLPTTRSARVVAGSVSTATPSSSTPQRIARVGQPRPNTTTPPTHSATSPPRKIPRPVHPVYWIEVFNPAYQKWLSVDALCTRTVNKPHHLEPALNDPQNSLTYAVAFNEDGTAKDVTMRYTRQYNAKVRKLRVEFTDGGATWWKRAMRSFQFRGRAKKDSEAIEDAELEQKLAKEGMPSNISDFKGHPLFALERHLRATEAIHPRHVVGKVNAGTSARPRMEDVFRRGDVHVCRSADKWFRLGRDVKAGEEALRHAKARPRRERRASSDELGDGADLFGEELGAGLYALFQTQVHVPPPVVNGRVPRNAYGNLDVYVSSMVPSGGVHVRHPRAKAAARILGIDLVEAVVGFKFQGRRGTAVTLGGVVASEYAEAMRAVIQGLQEEQQTQIEAKRSSEMLRLWKKFLVGLRVAERMKQYKLEFGDDGLDEVRDEDHDLQREIDEEMDRVDELGQAGGFFADQDQPIAQPVAIDDLPSREESTGFLPLDNIFDFGVIRIPERKTSPTMKGNSDKAGCLIAEELSMQPGDQFSADVDVDGGGFIVDEPVVSDVPNVENSEEGGGLVVEEDVDMNGDVQLTPNLPKEVDMPAVTGHGEEENAALPVSPTQNSKSDVVDDSISQDPEVEHTAADHPDKAESNDLDVGTSLGMDAEMEDLDIDTDIPIDAAEEKLEEMLEEAREETRMNADSDEDLDHGSLPSHDPDDEDADPEWIY